MSLSSSLNAAVAGLGLTSQRAELVARNVANADRPGYVRRDLNIGGPSVGVPGSTTTVSRELEPRLLQLRREAQSQEAADRNLAAFATTFDAELGDPDQPGSLQDRIARLDAAFVGAATEPQSDVRLREVVQAAADLTSYINGLDDTITRARQEADTGIDDAVTGLNRDLADVATLNIAIKRQGLSGAGTADLKDQRSVLVDRISAQIPVRSLSRDDGGIALVSTGGIMLLDGRAAQLGFNRRAPITPDMSVPTQLSGLTVNGRDVSISGSGSGIAGGGLSALFAVRDTVAPEATERLDSLAADLIDRFEDPAVDATRTPAQPGLFTDRGGPLAAAPRAGLAGRLELNGLVDPSRGGDLWRLRDGLGAASADPRGNPSTLLAYGTALAAAEVPALPGLPTIGLDFAGHAASLKSLASSARVQTEDRLAFSAGRSQALIDQRDGGAVDVDAEMRRLIEIEQAYAANARVIQAVGDMMNRLTEI